MLVFSYQFHTDRDVLFCAEMLLVYTSTSLPYVRGMICTEHVFVDDPDT